MTKTTASQRLRVSVSVLLERAASLRHMLRRLTKVIAATSLRLPMFAKTRLQALAEIVGGKSYSDYKQLADVELDAVIVATPPVSHPEIACFFMERGTPVLCEKPLCLSVAEAETMIDTAEANNVLFTMASKFRYCADVIKAKGILASGILGDVLQFENAFTAKVDMSKRWNSERRSCRAAVC